MATKRVFTMMTVSDGTKVVKHGLATRSHIGTSGMTVTLFNKSGQTPQIFIEYGFAKKEEAITILHDLLQFFDDEYKDSGIVENALGTFLKETGRAVDVMDAAGQQVSMGRLTFKQKKEN